MIHSINMFDGKPAVKTPTEILDADVLKKNADILDVDILDANLTATETITFIPIEGAPSAAQSTAGVVQSVLICANTPKSSQLTNYIVNSDDLSAYVQYPSGLFSTLSLSNGPRRVRSIRLPWLELGGGLAAFAIISGVVVIDGLKQAKLSPSKPTAQLTPPKLTNIPKSNPLGPSQLGPSQMSVAELMNSGRSLRMPNSAVNFPTPQITSNPIASNSGNFGSLNMPSGNMKTVDLTQIGTTPIATNSTLPKPTTAPLMPRRPIAMPKTEVRGSQVLPASQKPVRTQLIPQQAIPQPVSQQPPLNPSAFPPQEIPKTPALPNSKFQSLMD